MHRKSLTKKAKDEENEKTHKETVNKLKDFAKGGGDYFGADPLNL